MLCACGFKYTPLWIQGLKRLVLWTQNLTLLEDQGLWTQTPVLHISYAKAASKSEAFEKFIEFKNEVEKQSEKGIKIFRLD